MKKDINFIKDRIVILQKEIKKIESEKKQRIGAEFLKTFDGKEEITEQDILFFFDELKKLNLFAGAVKLSINSELKPEPKNSFTEVKNVSL